VADRSRSTSPHTRKESGKEGRPVADILPDRLSLPAVRKAAAHCRACHLYARATQTVFGEGPRQTPIMMVGEQPGDVEDVEGHPFVGPAGRLLDRALEQASIDRRLVYLTNVVKHFKWEPRGKRRIHVEPSTAEVAACRPWLDTEIELVEPRILVCLGAVAAQALLGRTFKVSVDRGRFLDSTLAPLVTATVHPSSILRARDDDSRREAMDHFVADLRIVAAEIARAPRDRAGSR
jgi:uracil-DNA glycosylase family protein